MSGMPLVDRRLAPEEVIIPFALNGCECNQPDMNEVVAEDGVGSYEVDFLRIDCVNVIITIHVSAPDPWVFKATG